MIGFELFGFSMDDEGHADFHLLEIRWGKRLGALAGFGWNGDGSLGIDLFWVGMTVEQPD